MTAGKKVISSAWWPSHSTSGKRTSSDPDQVVGSDRFSSYAWIAARWRQICWAHRRRDFQAMIDRGGDGKPIGEMLLKQSQRLFHHWHRVRDGTRDWETFGAVQGIEPTNNATERSLRFAVIWRRISGGTDNEQGSRFVERTLSVVATCRQQGRNVLDYLTSCFEAEHHGQPIPSLLPTRQPETNAA